MELIVFLEWDVREDGFKNDFKVFVLNSWKGGGVVIWGRESSRRGL